MPRFSRPVNIVVFVLILVPCLARGAMADLRSGVVSNGGAAPSERTPALGQSYSSLFSFSGADGETPTTGLVAVKRTLYGTAPGGANGFGIVYTITKAGRERVAYSFQGPPDGESPGPLLNIDGQLYGATAVGGSGTLCKSSSGCGAVFRFDPKTGREAVVYSFQGGSDGAAPTGPLIDVHGILYEPTSQGGSGYGTVFELTASGSEHVIYRFQGGRDGSTPLAGMINVNGLLYGTTAYGGRGNCGPGSQPVGCGTVFSITRSGVEHVLYRFKGGRDAQGPTTALTNLNGSLYGTTYRGGASDDGAVFVIELSGSERVIYNFGGEPDGGFPLAGLTSDNGRLYGTTYLGGHGACYANFGCGAIFAVTPAGAENVLYRFGGGLDGSNPEASLTVLDGRLYGTTPFGGAYSCNCGTVFSLKP